MTDSTDKGAEPPFYKDTDLTTTIEDKKDDFLKWTLETEEKCVDKQIILSPNYKIDIGKLGHGIVWNIYNLRCERNAKFPNTLPSTKMLGGAKLWMEAFCSYSLGIMKEFVMNEYIRIFNSPKYDSLRGNNKRFIISFNEIVDRMKNSESEEV